MTTVALRNSTVVIYASRTNTVLTAPTGIQDGDLLLIFHIIGAGSLPSVTPPSGFALVPGPTFPVIVTGDDGFSVGSRLYWKVASSESGDYTVTHAAATAQGWIVAYSGADIGTPFSPDATSNNDTGTTSTATGLTTLRDGSMVVFLEHDWGVTQNDLAVPTGTTPIFTKEFGPSATFGIIFVADGVLSTAGATGNKSITNNNTVSKPAVTYLVSIQPTTTVIPLGDLVIVAGSGPP